MNTEEEAKPEPGLGEIIGGLASRVDALEHEVSAMRKKLFNLEHHPDVDKLTDSVERSLTRKIVMQVGQSKR